MKENDFRCDVLVAGGGVSGALAAIASARAGAKTLLVEKEKALGGTGALALLRDICGLYLNGPDEPKGTLNRGLVEKVVGGLTELSPHTAPVKTGKVFVLPYSGFHMRSVLSSLCTKESNLTVFLETQAISVSCKRGRIEEVLLFVSGNTRRVIPNAVVDCTGGGNLSYMAGASFELSSELQLAGYTLRLRGLSGNDWKLSIKVPYHLAEAVRKGLLPDYLRFTHYSPGDLPDEGYLRFNTDANALAEEDALSALRLLSEGLPPFRECRIAGSSAGVFQREGRRVCGEYMLTGEDVLGARKFKDGVVKNSWPIELWDRKKGPVYKYLKDSDYYEIPLRCLKSRDVENLLLGGRCISATQEALGSTRVMGACMAIGEQAGLAAARTASGDRLKAEG